MEIIKRIFKDVVNFIWYTLSYATLKDVRASTMDDNVFHFDLHTGRDAKIHLCKKHFSPIVRKVVNDMLVDQRYVVTEMKYRFRGMDVFVTRK